MSEPGNGGERDFVEATDPEIVINPDFVQDMLALERRRIDTQDRRLKIADKALDVSEAAEKRQFDYHIKKLELDGSASDKNRSVAAAFSWAVFSLMAFVILVFLYMLFLGTDTQRITSLSILQFLATALGGGGGILFLGYLVRRLRELVVRD